MKGRKPDLRVIENSSPPEEIPLAPDHIPEPMREEWLKVAADLRDRKLLNEAMGGSLDAYIMALWNMRRAQQMIDQHGELIGDGKGSLKANPAINLLGKAQEVFLRLSTELGLTPVARSRAAFQPPKEKDNDIFSHAGL
ncbi:MAG TPA: phage terminase small subunit P27 family [Rhizobiaceae bacterium]|nr:phage terminase small subunit P27 family [Rhizobiaceae bacterium]